MNRPLVTLMRRPTVIVQSPGAVRVVGVVSRCGNCQREFRVGLDADSSIPAEAWACGDPRCMRATSGLAEA